MLRLLAFGALAVSAAARADVRLEVTGVEGALERNVRAYAGTPPAQENDAAVRAFAENAVEQAKRALEAMGYYDARITMDRRRQKNDWVVTLHVKRGEPVIVRSVNVHIEGPGKNEKAFRSLLGQLPVRKGRRLIHGSYEEAKNALRNVALNRGYFDYRFVTHRVKVHTREHRADVELVLDTGPRYSFGDVTFPKTPLREELLKRIAPFHTGDPYSSEAVADFNRRLLDSGYFSDVEVNTQRDKAGPNHRIPVDVQLTTRDPNTIGLGLGYSTDEGPRGRVSWDRHYVNARGHSLHNDIQVSRVTQNISSRYVIPLQDPLRDKLEINGGFQWEKLQDTDSRRITLGVQRQQEFNSGWTRTQSVRWLDERFRQADDVAHTTLVMPGLAFRRTRSRGGVDPYWGDQQSYSVEVGNRYLLSDIDLARVVVGGKLLRSLDDRHKHRVLLRLNGGAIASSDFTRVPASLRFFAGGDQSVRGYGYQTLSPTNSSGELTGGRFLLTGSVEYDYQFANHWRLALFTDAGNAFDDIREGYKVGSGFGVHWLSPVGPIRLDFAWGVSEPDTPFRIHFSMGPPL